MARTQHTVSGSELARIVADPKHGVISLVGDRGDLSLITGDINASSLIMSTLVVETEHGTVYLDPEAEIRISEDDGESLDSRVAGSVFAINDILTSHLAERFSWFAVDEEQYDALNDLTHTVAEAVDDLLMQFPA